MVSPRRTRYHLNFRTAKQHQFTRFKPAPTSRSQFNWLQHRKLSFVSLTFSFFVQMMFNTVMRTGWDMDPFVVIYFGKKVFRTHIVRPSRNHVWGEKLCFTFDNVVLSLSALSIQHTTPNMLHLPSYCTSPPPTSNTLFFQQSLASLVLTLSMLKRLAQSNRNSASSRPSTEIRRKVMVGWSLWAHWRRKRDEI